jgi:hypothetical protein
VLWRLEHAIREPYSVAPHVSFLDSSPVPCLLALCLRPWRSVPRFRRWRPRFSIPTTGIAFLRPSPARRPAGAWGDRRRRPQVGLRSGPWKPFRQRDLRGRRTRARPDESGSPVPTGPHARRLSRIGGTQGPLLQPPTGPPPHGDRTLAFTHSHGQVVEREAARPPSHMSTCPFSSGNVGTERPREPPPLTSAPRVRLPCPHPSACRLGIGAGPTAPFAGSRRAFHSEMKCILRYII